MAPKNLDKLPFFGTLPLLQHINHQISLLDALTSLASRGGFDKDNEFVYKYKDKGKKLRKVQYLAKIYCSEGLCIFQDFRSQNCFWAQWSPSNPKNISFIHTNFAFALNS